MPNTDGYTVMAYGYGHSFESLYSYGLYTVVMATASRANTFMALQLWPYSYGLIVVAL